MKRSQLTIGCLIAGLVVLSILTGLLVITELAKRDAVTHMSRHGATDAYVHRIQPSLHHGLWMEVRFSNPEAQVTGMHWYLIPWRDYEVIE
jgi:hypothetical protein